MKLGVLASIEPEVIAPVLQSFAVKHPGLEVTVEEAMLDEIKLRLDDNTLDAAIVSSADLIVGAYNFHPLYTENYVVALPPEHWLKDRETVEFRDLDQEAYIDRLSCEMRDRIARNCEGYEIEFYARFRSDREGWVAEMVRAGIGFAFLPEKVAASKGLLTKPLRNPSIERTVNIMTVMGRQSLPGLKDLVDHVNATMRSADMTASLNAANVIDKRRTALQLASHIRRQTNAPQLSAQYPTLTIEDAYQIQDHVVDTLTSQDASQVCGWKIGGANRKVLEQMGIMEPFYGRMLRSDCVADGGTVPIRDFDYVSPELEICFELAEDLFGPELSEMDVLAAVRRAYVGIEITMPRFPNWKFTHIDAVAANSGFSGYVLGDAITLSNIPDLDGLNAFLLVDGTVSQSGTSSNALGHPLKSLATAANQLAKLGYGLKAGHLYFSGSLTPKLHLRGPCMLEGQIEGIGSVRANFVSV